MDVEGFKEARMRNMPNELARFRWLRALEKDMEFGKRSVSTTLWQYYSEAAQCYVVGCYLASTAIAASAIESELRSRLHGIPIPDKKTYAPNMIEEARKGHYITSDFADRLKRLQATMRNQVVHPYSMFGVSFLGLKRRDGPKKKDPDDPKEKPKPLYGPSDEDFEKYPDKVWPTSLTLKGAAEEALECLLRLNQGWGFKVPEDR